MSDSAHYVMPLPEYAMKRKYQRQRAKRGWADCDAWSVDYYLSHVLVGLIGRLRENKLGHPVMPDCTDIERHDGCGCYEKWLAILDEMIEGFRVGASDDCFDLGEHVPIGDAGVGGQFLP